MDTNRVYLFDTTLRDGEQMPGVNLNVKEKVLIAAQLERLGVDAIEAGFPASSVGDFEAVREVANLVKNAAVVGLCRTTLSDIDRAFEAIQNAAKPRIHTFIATSPIHMEYKLKMTPDQVFQNAVAAVRHAKALCQDVEFSCEDATRSDPAFMYRILEAVIEEGATVVNIPDTVGYTTPQEYYGLIDGIMKNVPNIRKAIVSVHCHNDLGLAVANSIAGVMAGARQVEGAINGLGERAGNAAIEEVVMGLNTRKDFYHLTHGLDISQIYRTSRMVESIAGVDLPPNKAVVGGNAFKHESGIHQHGVLENAQTYEIMTPESIGLVQNNIVLGKHSGRHAFAERLKELGYSVTDEQLNALFVSFKELADRKKDINDRDIEALVGGNMHVQERAYELESFQIQTGNKMQSIASVCLKHDGETLCEAAVGDGPVDAAFNAIDRIVKKNIQLESYAIKGVTEGRDALGEVTVRISCDGATQTGKGLDSDILASSIHAYLNAINRMAQG